MKFISFSTNFILKKTKSESASKLHINDKYKEEPTVLEKIQEQEESEIECSRHLSINQEKQSPLQIVSDQPNEGHIVENPNMIIDDEEEIMFINVYPEKRKIEEKIKKSGIQTNNDNKANAEKNNMKKNEEIYLMDELAAETISNSVVKQEEKIHVFPKAVFLNNVNDVREISEEENQNFRYSKMDEKTAEILYKER